MSVSGSKANPFDRATVERVVGEGGATAQGREGKASTALLSAISETSPLLAIQLRRRSSRPSSAAQAVQHLRVGLLMSKALREAGAQAQHVALFHLDLILLHDRHQVVEARS